MKVLKTHFSQKKTAEWYSCLLTANYSRDFDEYFIISTHWKRVKPSTSDVWTEILSAVMGWLCKITTQCGEPSQTSSLEALWKYIVNYVFHIPDKNTPSSFSTSGWKTYLMFLLWGIENRKLPLLPLSWEFALLHNLYHMLLYLFMSSTPSAAK